MPVPTPTVSINMTQAELTNLIVLIKSHTTSRDGARNILPRLEYARSIMRGDNVRLGSNSR